MTPTATYIAEENCLQELPQWIAPRPSVDGIFGPYAEIDRSRMIAYKKHLATLRKIPCDASCKGLWADGQKVVEGKDYEVARKHPDSIHVDQPQYMAFPLVPVKSEGQPGEIEKLRAENSKMRKALEEIAQKYADAEVLDDIGQFVFEMGELATEALK